MIGRDSWPAARDFTAGNFKSRNLTAGNSTAGGFTAGGFTVVELLVVMALVGVLVSLLLPAVQAARESSRALTCLSHLRQVGQATIQFHDAYGAYPPARIQPKMQATAPHDCGGRHPSWLVRILPFLEHSSEYANWDVTKPYGEHPAEVTEGVVLVYSCPSRRAGNDAVVAAKTVQTWVQLPCGCGALRTIQVLDHGAWGNVKIEHDHGGLVDRRFAEFATSGLRYMVGVHQANEFTISVDEISPKHP